MKILVERLEETPTDIAFEAGPAWWRAWMPTDRSLPREPSAPFEVAIRAHRMAEDLYLEGVLSGAVDVECSCCLACYRHALHETFRLVLEPAGSRVPADPEGAAALARDGLCLKEEIEAGWYRGSELDLGAFLHEIVSLELPVKPLCREDCAGLCPRCGADMNNDPCECAEVPADSPFAALAALRTGPNEGDS
jgi:uncharacterized protein